MEKDQKVAKVSVLGAGMLAAAVDKGLGHSGIMAIADVLKK